MMQDIMEGLQQYGEKFRKNYDLPLISTPWSVVNHSLTNASLIDILSETSIYASYSIKNSRRMFFFDELYENLMQRDDLNRRLWMLKKNNPQGNLALQKNLEQQIKKLTSEIKRGLNAKIDQKLTKYLSSFGHDEIRKMKMGSFSMKMAKKNQLTATRLDILNRSGVTKLKDVVRNLQVIGNHAGKISTVLGVGAVAYDVVSAHQKGNSTARAFLTGAAGISTSMALSASSISLSSLGASIMSSTLVLGGVAGEAAAGATTLFLCTSAGPIVLAVAGIGAVGYVNYQVAEYVGEYYDKNLAEQWDKYGDMVSQEILDCVRLVNEMIDKAWNTSSQWILDFYQPSKK